jgi:hypothetical protein
VTAFLYIRDVTRDILSAAAGAFAYGLSVFSLHRAAQVDNAHLTVVLIPLALLAIRRVRPDHLAGPFVTLTMIMTSLAFWGFLQEVAYAFIFFGCYALYRAGMSKNNGRWHGLAPLIVMAADMMVPRGGIEPPTLRFSGSSFSIRSNHLAMKNVSNRALMLNGIERICLTRAASQRP